MLCANTENLPLRGVDVGASDPATANKPIGLVNVYVDLNTTSVIKKEDKQRRKPGQVEPEDLVRDMGSGAERGETRPLPVLEAVISNRQMVLLGDPGSGKSTFANFLSYCLAANAIEPEAGWLDHLPDWPQAESRILPVVVVLRDFARRHAASLPAKAEPTHLWDFIQERLHAQNLDGAAAPLGKALEQGQVLLLLDGLDEVPGDNQRRFVRDAAAAFLIRYPKIRCLATCRILSYQPPARKDQPDLRLSGLPEFTLAPFESEQIDRFIQAWYSELMRLGTVTEEDKPGMIERLQGAVRRTDLRRLAPNPLLLTVMALVHTHKGRLPDARAMLYEETVEILLWRWEQVKLAGQDSSALLRQLLLQAGRTDIDLKRILWQLAYEAHAQSGEDDDGTRLADIPEYRLEKTLAGLKDGDRNWAMQVVEVMKLRSGLLIERAPEIFTFPHRTFQEYLAGAHLASMTDYCGQAARLAVQGSAWREVILLSAGKLVYVNGELDRPLALVGELCPAKVRDDPACWRMAWLAGDVLLEIGANRARDSALGSDLVEHVQQRLVG